MPKTVKRLVCLATTLVLMSSVAEAKTVNVTCGSAKINDVLKTLDPSQSNVIRVNGVCDEFVTITDFAQLSIVGSAKGSSGISGSNAAALLWIVRSHVQISNLTLNGGSWGVMCRDSSVCTLSGNSIAAASQTGVEINNADATFNGDVIQDNSKCGLLLSAARVRLSNAAIKNTVAGAWPPGFGIYAHTGSAISVDGPLTIDGNADAGISLASSSTLVNNAWNRFNVTNNGGGIWVAGNSSASLGGVIITGNGPGGTDATGLTVTSNSSVGFWSGGTITGNKPVDMYCSVNGIAAGLQGVTVETSNCVDPYP
jgi:hypothetical protein